MGIKDRVHRSAEKGSGRADQQKRRKPVNDLENPSQQHRKEDAIDSLALEPAPGAYEHAAEHSAESAGDAKQRKRGFESAAAYCPIGGQIELDKQGHNNPGWGASEVGDGKGGEQPEQWTT